MFLRRYAKERMVYVDETGIDNTLDYPTAIVIIQSDFPGSDWGIERNASA
jgi:hypothetical protein